MNASGVNVSTYHSFCMDIIKQNPGDFELIDGFQMADDITKQALLKECIDGEDKANPYTDDELADMLKSKGYPIARRTVAKYRQQLNIPVARLRR